MYYDDQDYEDELDELNPEVEVLGSYYGVGYLIKRLHYGDFRAGYNKALIDYAKNPESLGFEKIEPSESRKSPQMRSISSSNAPQGKAPAKKQPKKTAGKGRR